MLRTYYFKPVVKGGELMLANFGETKNISTGETCLDDRKVATIKERITEVVQTESDTTDINITKDGKFWKATFKQVNVFFWQDRIYPGC